MIMQIQYTPFADCGVWGDDASLFQNEHDMLVILPLDYTYIGFERKDSGVDLTYKPVAIVADRDGLVKAKGFFKPGAARPGPLPFANLDSRLASTSQSVNAGASASQSVNAGAPMTQSENAGAEDGDGIDG